jgi:hypothetical protein
MSKPCATFSRPAAESAVPGSSMPCESSVTLASPMLATRGAFRLSSPWVSMAAPERMGGATSGTSAARRAE